MTTPEFAEADLPEMPPYDRISHEAKCTRIFWDEASMRAYALAAVATYHEKLTEQQPVFEVGFGWLDDATKYPRGTKLYATSMLQDKPDGFIHPDNVHRLQSGETVAFRKKPYEHDGGGLPVYVGAKPQVNESEAMKALHALVMLLDQGCDTPGALGHVDFVNAIARARAVLAGEPGEKAEQPVEWQPLGRILGPGSKPNSLRIEMVELPKQAQAEQPRDESLPERNPEEPAERQGLFRKFDVRRVDGSDQPGGKHHGCRYFVLDVDHDTHAIAALTAYAASCETAYPDLARDLRENWGALEQPKQARAMDEREWFHIWFSGYIDSNSGPTERNVKRLPAWHGWQARAVLAQAQASGKHCPHPTECFDHTKGHLCDDCRDKPQAGEKAASTGELE